MRLSSAALTSGGPTGGVPGVSSWTPPRRRLATAATPSPPATIPTMPCLDGLRETALFLAELRPAKTPVTALVLPAGCGPEGWPAPAHPDRTVPSRA